MIFKNNNSILLFLLFFSCNIAAAQVISSAKADSSSTPPAKKAPVSLTVPVEFADTIPDGFFHIVERLGLNKYTHRLISRFEEIPETLILESLAQSNKQVDYQRANAYSVAFVIELFCRMDSTWADFFSDIEMQFREPNILRVSFRDDQKWKSYTLNELFYSEFFQELLLILGNIGIASSRDGKQWLDGWPDELRWKYREYRFEYMPEDMEIRVLDLRRATRGTSTSLQNEQPTTTVRLLPSNPVLPVEPGDTVESPLRTPDF